MTLMYHETPEGPLLHRPMVEYMEDIMTKKQGRSKVVDSIFRADALACANRSIKSGNFYILDKYNIIIRKSEQNKTKSAYGWTYNADNEPINIHIPKVLLDTNSKDITTVTLQNMKAKFPALFKAPRGHIYRVYSMVNLPDVDITKI